VKVRLTLRPSPSSRALFCIAVAALVAGGQAVGAETVYTTDLETNPFASGWTVNWGAAPTSDNFWTDATARSGSHCITGGGDTWASTTFAVQPMEYYSVQFYSKANTAGQYGMIGNDTLTYRASSQWVLNEGVSRTGLGATVDRVWFFPTSAPPAYFDDLTVRHISSQEAAQQLDKNYAAMQQFDFAALAGPEDRHANIPRTMQALTTGGTMNVVLLGDSIMSNTSNSLFETLVERMYPGSRMNVTASWAGSTGCWWYKEEGRVQSYVLDYDPDLVMIGGIGNFDDIDSIREVITQIRAGKGDCDILLMTGLAGSAMSPYVHPEFMLPIDPNGQDYRAALWRLAEEQGVGFVDMTRPWMEYIASTGRAYDEFLKDGVHCNTDGITIIGRILEAYFESAPEPSTAAILLLGVALLRRRPNR